MLPPSRCQSAMDVAVAGGEEPGGENQSPGSGLSCLLPRLTHTLVAAVRLATDRQVGAVPAFLLLSAPTAPNAPSQRAVQPAPMCGVGRRGVRIRRRDGGLGPRPKSRMTDDRLTMHAPARTLRGSGATRGREGGANKQRVSLNRQRAPYPRLCWYIVGT